MHCFAEFAWVMFCCSVHFFVRCDVPTECKCTRVLRANYRVQSSNWLFYFAIVRVNERYTMHRIRVPLGNASGRRAGRISFFSWLMLIGLYRRFVFVFCDCFLAVAMI